MEKLLYIGPADGFFSQEKFHIFLASLGEIELFFSTGNSNDLNPTRIYKSIKEELYLRYSIIKKDNEIQNKFEAEIFLFGEPHLINNLEKIILEKAKEYAKSL